MDLRHARRLVVAVIGGTVLLLGVVMLVTPGPGIVTILAGLAVLATEFIWARRLLKRAREHADGAHEGLKAAWRQWWRGKKSRSVSADENSPGKD
jgi:uncharacterized protein (TIGR02611 family)